MTFFSGQRILLAIGVVVIVATGFAPAIPQDPLYHDLADQRRLFAVPNALNVLTNLLFAWVGIEGLYRLLRQKSLQVLAELVPVYIGFFGGLVLLAAGSSYYHWSPSNASLVWDRLPIALVSLSFLTHLVGEQVSTQSARRLFPWLIAVGVASVIYWYFSEVAGRGDLRPYALMILLPLILTPVLILLFESPWTRVTDVWWMLGWYLLARLCEYLDRTIFDWLILLSGHSLKHIAMAIACAVFLHHLRQRRRLLSA